MAPHALVASKKVLDLSDPELGVLYAINPVTGGLVSPWGAVPLDDDDDVNDVETPKLRGYVIAATVASVCLSVCLLVGVLVAVWCCIKRRRRIRSEALRNRPPTLIARGRASSEEEEEETADPPIPLATLPAAKIAVKTLAGEDRGA